MSGRISRREFQDNFGSRSGIDTTQVPKELAGALEAAGIDSSQLAELAGPNDTVISGDVEMGKLYDRLVAAQPEGRPAVDLSKSGALYAALDRATSPAAPSASAPASRAPGIGAPSSRRREVYLELDNPLTSPTAHASHYAAVPRLAGFALDALAEKYPSINRTFAGRFLEAAGLFGAQVPFMVGSHEYGHFRAGKEFGWDPEVELTGWPSGVTHYRSQPFNVPADQDTIAAAAGMNQETMNADYMFRDWALAGKVRYSEAMSFLLSKTNPALYPARTWALDIPPGGKDDIANYIQNMDAKGIKLSAGQLAAQGLLLDFLSAPALAAFIGEAKFVLKGDKLVDIPKFKMGANELTFPNFHQYLSTQGPIAGGQLFVNPQGKYPVQLSMDVRLADGALALGGKVHDLALGKGVSINPFIRATAGDVNGLMFGSDVRLQLGSRFSVMGTASFNRGDLLSDSEGRKGGLNLQLNIGIRR